MELIARCEACGVPLHERDDHHFDKEGIVWVCLACVEDEEDRLREEFGWIEAGRGDGAGKFVPDAKEPTCEHQPRTTASTPDHDHPFAAPARESDVPDSDRHEVGVVEATACRLTPTLTPRNRSPQPRRMMTMAFTAETGGFKTTRSDIFLVDPRTLVVDWNKNLSRNGEEPAVDEALIELAKDMMPKKGQGDGEDGTSGQLNPILTRPLPDRRLEVVGGFRRMRAALWLVESGTCPDFRVKYVVSRLSDAEAALVNLSENLQREDPKPIHMAHAIRALTEDYGLTMKQVAGRLKRSESWLNNLLNLVMLPTAIKASVASGQTPVAAALELVKLPRDEQVAVFDALAGGGEKITAARVKQKRQEVHEETGQGGPIPRSLKQLKKFLEGKTGPQDYSKNFATYLLAWLDAERSDDSLDKYWDRAFAEPSGPRMTG